MVLLLGESHLRRVLTMPALVPLMERALAAFSTGGVVQPLRCVVPVHDHAGFLGAMPAYIPSRQALGLKAVAVFPRNAGHALPTHQATILYLDAGTGRLLAVMDGRLITEMRTGAVSAAATRHLNTSRSPVIALLGAGVQARSHAQALAAVCRPELIRVWSRTDARARDCAAAINDDTGVPVTVCRSPEDTVRDADVICTVTASQTPILRSAWVKPGAHINAVGACRPDWRELEGDLVARACLFVDSREGALSEAGDIVLAIREGKIRAEHIAAEIGEVFAGRHPGRTAADEVTLFKSLGMAVEDVAVAGHAYAHAIESGIGRRITLDGDTEG